jgi:two-component system, response regulator PdtaR
MTGASVLIVEDDDILARVEDWRLKNLGYMISGRAATGAEAMEVVINKRPDVVLMDINIRGTMDGIETAQMIKKGYNIPVVYMSSHPDDATVERAKATRPEGFIVKPFHDADLRVALELAVNKEK